MLGTPAGNVRNSDSSCYASEKDIKTHMNFHLLADTLNVMAEEFGFFFGCDAILSGTNL